MLKMSKVCCIEDANICPKSSSCSMVLRSACSHGHSHESTTVQNHSRASSHRKRKLTSASKKDLCNGSLYLESLESSLNGLDFKSVEKAYSLLTGPLYNSLELTKSASQKDVETSSSNVIKHLHFSQLSISNNSSACNINHKEYNSDYSSATESDMNSSEPRDSSSSTSRSRRLTRSSVSSVRSFSGSEDEDDISVLSIVRQRPNINNRNSVPLSRFLEQNTNNQKSDNHTSYSARHYGLYRGSSDNLTNFSESSYSDTSVAVQGSLFQKFRWFLWKYAYLMIINSINFDTWILSRIHNYGKYKAIFFVLLPLLLVFLWAMMQQNFTQEELQPNVNYNQNASLKSYISSVSDFVSSTFSSFIGYFSQKDESISVSDVHPNSCSDSGRISTFVHYFSGFFGASWFAETKENSQSESNYDVREIIHTDKIQTDKIEITQPSEEQIKLLVINSLKEYMGTSMQQAEAHKEEKYLKLQNEINKLRFEFQSLTKAMEVLEDTINRDEKSEMVKNKIVALTVDYKSQIDHLNVKLKSMEAKLNNLENLSQEDFLAFLEKHLILAFKNIVDGDSHPKSKYSFFNAWLSSKFFGQEKATQEMNVALKKQSDDVIKVFENTISKFIDSIRRNLTELNSSCCSTSSFSAGVFSEDQIRKIVKEAIMLYDADKTGQVDYALESGGGSVVGTRCSETYVEKYGKVILFGVPLWTKSNSPRTAIQPDIQPGQCWPFKGSQGFLVIELSATIYPTGFTMEHIPVTLSPSGSIDSAPKNFSVWGLDSEKDNEGSLLGEYSYDINGEPLQYFPIEKPCEKPYTYVELQIHSNHGNMDYTCVYRFRVHGKRV